jgi:DNA-binding helix-hairpin-helix protein with protein kinase domain
LLQEQHVSSYLGRASIQSAKIPGIGPGIAKSLIANGVMTAADFTGASYSGDQVMIKLRNGYYVHPKGVGEKKALALDSWRRTLEMQARATQPSRIPPTQAQAIRAKYVQQRQNLANEEQTAHARASVELNQISQKWMQTHTSISAELVSIRQAFAQEKVQADVEMTAVQKQASATTWQRDLAAREISAHRKINYLRYLTGIIRT